MRLLTRQEEMVLLAVFRLEDNAYGVTVSKTLTETSREEWVLSKVYVPLERLEQKGLLRSYLSDPVSERGGRSKRIYNLTDEGLRSLIKIKSVEESLWKNISKISLEDGLDSG